MCIYYYWHKMDIGYLHRMDMWMMVYILLALETTGADESNTAETALEQFVQHMSGKHWDLRLPPSSNKSMQVPVDVGVYVNQIGEINEMDADFSVNIFFRQIWKDPRLAWQGIINHNGSISLPDPFFKDIWKPDTYIQNGKEERKHTVTMENHSFRVYADGKIFYSQRLTLKLWCTLYLANFPLDNQTCQLQFSSYRYTQEEMKLNWLAGKPVENVLNVKLARFALKDVFKGDCTAGYSTGAYSCVYLEFDFMRLFGYYLIQIYVPSGIIVILSWVSFWLDPIAVPGRISLGVLTILTMSTQMGSAATSALPKVSYIKAIDIWLVTCMMFLFTALLEFALVNSLARHDISKANKLVPDEDEPKFKVFVHKVLFLRHQNRLAQAEASSNGSADVPVGTEDVEMKDKGFCRKPRLTAVAVDIASRIAFPVLFLIFNAVYWYFYYR